MELTPIRHGMVDSTNERALDDIASGRARHGDLHLAEAQSAGRGTRGRTWVDTPGESVLASVVLLPHRPLRHPEVLTMAAGLALLEAARAVGLERARLEWPNDLMVGRAKLAGILVESRGFHTARPHHVVGVGWNVSQRTFPATLLDEREVSSLALEGLSVGIAEAERALGEALGLHLGHALLAPAEVAEAFARATGLIGREVEVGSAQQSVAGLLVELDLERGLRLAGADWERWLPLPHVTSVRPVRT